MLVAFVGVVAANLSRLVTDATLSQKSIEARLAAYSLRLSLLRHLSDPETCLANFELVNPRTNANDPERVVNIANNTNFIEEFSLNQTTYEGGKILVRSIEFQAFNPLFENSEFGVAVLHVGFESTVNIAGPRELTRVSRPLLLAAQLNPSGRIVECAAIGDDEGNFWQVSGEGRASSGNIFYTGSRVGIGTMATSVALTVHGSVQVQGRVEAESLQVSGEINTENFLADQYLHTSDAGLKMNVRTAPGLDLVRKLRGVNFVWKDTGLPSTGVIAQEVQSVVGESVSTDEAGMLSVDYTHIETILINALRDLKSEQENLESRLERINEKLSQ